VFRYLLKLSLDYQGLTRWISRTGTNRVNECTFTCNAHSTCATYDDDNSLNCYYLRLCAQNSILNRVPLRQYPKSKVGSGQFVWISHSFDCKDSADCYSSFSSSHHFWICALMPYCPRDMSAPFNLRYVKLRCQGLRTSRIVFDTFHCRQSCHSV
jgi:hypothetical protein